MLLLAFAAAACGKKGPPLAPFSNLPAAVTAFRARRVGPQVVLQFTVPTTNIDRRQPADLDRIDLYSHPTRLPRPADYLRRGMIVGFVKVRRPPPADETGAPAPPATSEAGVDQGAVAVIVDTPDPSEPPPEAPARPPEILPEIPPLFPDGGAWLLPRRSQFAARYYVAVGVNRRGRNGAPSPVVEVTLAPAPAPPAAVKVTYTEKALVVSWSPPALPLGGPVQEPSPQGRALPSRAVVSFSGSSGYNVYEAPSSTAGGEGTAVAPGPAVLNRSLLAATQFDVPGITFGAERCFVVRSQETLGTVAIESAVSQRACVTPVDTFAPGPPRSAGAVASEGAISLIWEPSNDADLAGYLVLRGEAPSGTLQALTAAPIADTTYRDATVRSGVAYVYAVVAVDKAKNISAQSNRVSEKAR